jgi:GLPGLI family protein
MIKIMKWILLLATVFTISAPGAVAQQPDVAQILVHYKFSHVRDTTNRDRPYTENMVLLVGKRSGIYKSNEGRMQQQVSTNPDGTTRTDTREFGSAAEYYQFPNEKRLIRKDKILFADFIISDALPSIVWRISSDTATFGSLHCQKATTHFKGRDYTAWFCPDLPLHIGPWKLNGLPGVIVEAYDVKKEVRFTFDGISKIDPMAFQAPEKGVKTTEKEFAKLQETFRKDPQAFVNGMMAQGGGMGDNGRPPPKIDIKPDPGAVINNPIELPEKK